MTQSLLYKTAKVLSVVGHPLLTLSLFSMYVAFQKLPLNNAVTVTGLLIGGVAIPIAWQNYRRVRRGQYTNFDVSDQRQRAQFYPVLIGLMALVTALLFATGQPLAFGYGAVCLLGLLLVSYGINRFIKVSLHTSLSIFLTWAVYSLSPLFGVVMGVLAVLVALSRLVLKRHTLTEILVGALVGLITGIGFYTIIT